MYKHIAYGGVVVAAAVALSGLGGRGAAASATADRAGQPAGHAVATADTPRAVPGTQLWVQRYHGPRCDALGYVDELPASQPGRVWHRHSGAIIRAGQAPAACHHERGSACRPAGGTLLLLLR
jgi:hypothetical protein